MNKYVVEIHMPLYITYAESADEAERKALKILVDAVSKGEKIGCTLRGIDVGEMEKLYLESDPNGVVVCVAGETTGHIDIRELNG